jgi:hypothetical protein
MNRIKTGLMLFLFGAAPLVTAGCGGDEETCDPVAQTGCEDGHVCEEVQGGEPACFSPVVVKGDVFDLADDAAVSGARVVALDVNRSPVSSVAVSGDDGSYELAIPTTRDADGNLVAANITLRADAAGFQTFPSGLRRSLPIDVSTATGDDSGWTIESSLTSIGLIELPGDAGTNTIQGSVEVPGDQVGVLVVAESDSTGYTAIADRDGDYAIFNVPDGDFSVTGYARGHNYTPADASVSGGSSADVDLSLSDQAASSVSGKVDIVNPGQGTGTSVILVVESTFDAALARGESPPGLRAPAPGTEPNITGDFTIDGVPAGRYVVLAAFENDNLVRDPDTCIAGTDIVHQEVAAGDDVTIEQQFKVTGALDVIAPGADGAEQVDGKPTLKWVDDSSEDAYAVTVVDAFGNTVWEDEIAGVSGGTPQVAYGGPDLDPGMYYQFRVVSTKTQGGVNGQTCEIAQTEDLKGVFFSP